MGGPTEALEQKRAGLTRDPLGQLEVGAQKIARMTTTSTITAPATTATWIRKRNMSRSDRRGFHMSSS